MPSAPASRDLANAIRALSMDAVQKANSGHPGAPMGMADIAEVLWRGFMQHNPADPTWADRDRFVLSNGHGSMLLYSLLLLALCGSSAPFGGQGMFVLRDAWSFDKHHSTLSPFAAAVPKGIARPAPLSHHVLAG